MSCLSSPHLPAVLRPASLSEWMGEECVLSGVCIRDAQVDSQKFYKCEISQSVFENCRFEDCDFEGSAFFDVEFRGCSLRNSSFWGAYFERCHLVLCKGTGVRLNEAVLKETCFERCDLRYALLDGARLTAVSLRHCDLTEASLAGMRLKNFDADGCRFVKNNFFKTPLAGVDFSSCVLEGPAVSAPPFELKDVLIAPEQAAGLVGLLGVRIKR